MADGEPEKSSQFSLACRQFDTELAAYLEGDQTTRVAAHATECPCCDAILKDIGMIRAVAGDMPLETPPPGIWVNLRATLRAEGIIHQPERQWSAWLRGLVAPSRLAPATALAGLLALGIIFLSFPRAHRQPGTNSVVPGLDVSMAGVNFTAQELNLAQTVQQMEATYKTRSTSFSPSIQSTYQKGLESLDTCIRECLASVRQEPNNTLAREYLMEAYARKADVLASALEHNGH